MARIEPEIVIEDEPLLPLPEITPRRKAQEGSGQVEGESASMRSDATVTTPAGTVSGGGERDTVICDAESVCA